MSYSINPFTTETTMSDKKRKATSVTGPSAKQQKLVSMKEEKKQRDAGWLQERVNQQRIEKKDMKFNKKRLRFLSDTEKIKQGSDGVLYWMLRDHRVQGKSPKTVKNKLHAEAISPYMISVFIMLCVCFNFCSR